ncbi:equilibrative nucleoside transporter 4-like isoform X2 [Branchiostoma floridae]|uniref:Equilibrative nucleoside transporter 4-like isoform X2 n=1 Tax=Branchiostoma floridae TaxID=7739 RepID=A0A9J7N913_BRAFL|nr:equilibrative nucleoside transporter 4-like isoform X2 [Branchiostoma floridae]
MEDENESESTYGAATVSYGHMPEVEASSLGSTFDIPELHFRVPRDKYHLVYLALLLAGVGFLLPYNSFITDVDYLHARYPGTSIVFDMSLTYILVAFGAVLVNNSLIETFGTHTRITLGYGLAFFSLVFIAILDVWLEVFDKDTSYVMNLLAVSVVAFGCTVQQSSFYGYTSMLPPRYTQAAMTGESAAGLLVSLNRIVTKALVQDKRTNTVIFFCLSIFFVAACFISHQLVKRSKFVRHHLAACVSARSPDGVDGAFGEEILDSEPKEALTESPGTVSDDAQEEAEGSRQKSLRVRLKQTRSIKRGLLVRWQVSKQIWTYMLAIGSAYFITLCLFPGIESEVTNCTLGDWMPIVLMAIFNLFDFIGKILAAAPVEWEGGWLALASSIRILLVPLMMMCAAPRDSPILQGPGWSMFISLLLGLTNGYFGSVPMILAPREVEDEQKEITGNIMMLSYSLGLTAGSGLAYGLKAILGHELTYDPCAAANTTFYNSTILV